VNWRLVIDYLLALSQHGVPEAFIHIHLIEHQSELEDIYTFEYREHIVLVLSEERRNELFRGLVFRSEA
jgi:hypothetical protein